MVKLIDLTCLQKLKLELQHLIKILKLLLKDNKNVYQKGEVKNKFKSLIIEKDFEPENPKQLEELDENSCKWPIGHPDEKDFIFVADLL